MSISTRKLTQSDVDHVIPLLRKTHSFRSNKEAHDAFLLELSRGREYRGVHAGNELLGILGWEDRGLPHHGVVEVIRFSMPENPFLNQAAELLFDTSVASIDYFFKTKRERLRKIFMIISNNRTHACRFLEDRGLVSEGKLLRHYHDNRNELVYSLFNRR